LTLVLPPPFYLQPTLLPLVAGILYSSFLLQDITAHKLFVKLGVSENGSVDQ
jgi:hypothetical protein